MARAERLHRRFLGGESSREMDGRLATTVAVRDFSGREDSMEEPVPVAFHRRHDSRDVGRIEAEADDIWHDGTVGLMILPQPDDHFEWIDAASGPALVCRPLAAFAHHLFTSRVWSLGSNPAGAEQWAEVARAVGADSSTLLRGHQVHGAGIIVHRDGQPPGPPADADILMTGDSRVAAAVQSADCVPLLIADTRTGVVAAAHAGWRGLALGVPGAAVEAFENEFGSRASKLIAAIGPAIGACCYEVGSEVRDRFAAGGFSDWELARWFFREPRSSSRNPSMGGVPGQAREGHWFLDLWTVARDQLRVAGIREDRIFGAELCTASHADVFCSYRRDGQRAGRLAAVIQGQKTPG